MSCTRLRDLRRTIVIKVALWGEKSCTENSNFQVEIFRATAHHHDRLLLESILLKD